MTKIKTAMENYFDPHQNKKEDVIAGLERLDSDISTMIDELSILREQILAWKANPYLGRVHVDFLALI